jgi:hypothetical protein
MLDDHTGVGRLYRNDLAAQASGGHGPPRTTVSRSAWGWLQSANHHESASRKQVRTLSRLGITKRSQDLGFGSFRLQMKRRYLGRVITSVLGAPGSGKSAIVPDLAGLLPGHAVLDWDAFMRPAAALVGQEIPDNPATWPAYRELVHTVTGVMAHLPVVLLTVCTPDELNDWPIDTWALMDCSDQERHRRLGQHTGSLRLAHAIHDGREYRQLGLPVIDTTSRTPKAVAAELARFILSIYQRGDSEHLG